MIFNQNKKVERKTRKADRILESHNDFYDSIKDLIVDEHVQAMKDIQQHTKYISRYDHSLFVAYIAHKISLRLGADAKIAARGGLLHDFEKHDKVRKSTSPFKMFFIHSKVAKSHANEVFFLNEVEQDIIVKHMWPMTPHLLPKYKESFIVNLADKYCAAMELLGRHKNSKVLTISSIA